MPPGKLTRSNSVPNNIGQEKSLKGPEIKAGLVKRPRRGSVPDKANKSTPKVSLQALDLASSKGLDLNKVENHLSKLILKDVSPRKVRALSRLATMKHLPKPQVQTDPLEKVTIKKIMNTVSKKSVTAPNSATKEQEVGQILNDKMFKAIKGLKKVDTSQGRKLNNLLTYKGKTLGPKGIQKLLKSSDSLDNRAGKRALMALSELAKSPKTLSKAISKSTLDLGDVSSLQVQTQFIKASRSILTNTFFQGDLSSKLEKNIKNTPSLLRYNIKNVPNINKFVANVGFNRLMSENNMLGASLSSDVDFKLVLDDEKLAKQLKKDNPSASKSDINSAIKLIKSRIVGTLETAKDVMEQDFKLTLEVEGFTVKSISDLRGQASTSPIEQNFLATVLHNHSYMSGNEGVMDTFVDIIKENLDFKNIPNRNIQQYLGDSDKGSILAIENLEGIDSVVNNTTDLITQKTEVKTAIKKLPAYKKFLNGRKSSTGLMKEFLKSNPKKMKSIIHDVEHKILVNKVAQDHSGDFTASPEYNSFRGVKHDSMDLRKKFLDKNESLLNQIVDNRGIEKLSEEIVNDTSVDLDSVDMQNDKSPTKKLDLVLKLAGAFTKPLSDGTSSTKFIGRSDGTNSEEWIYSIKYAGCRLNDVFDSTPKSVYVMSDNRDIGDSIKVYDSAKGVAESVNSFAIQLQNRVYEKYQGEKSHSEIDELYDRVTADEFASMIDSGPSRQKMGEMLDSLVDTLTQAKSKFSEEDQQSIFGDLVEKISVVRGIVKSPLEIGSKKQIGHTLFNALFTITKNTANHLQPDTTPKVKPKVSQSLM